MCHQFFNMFLVEFGLGFSLFFFFSFRWKCVRANTWYRTESIQYCLLKAIRENKEAARQKHLFCINRSVLLAEVDESLTTHVCSPFIFLPSSSYFLYTFFMQSYLMFQYRCAAITTMVILKQVRCFSWSLPFILLCVCSFFLNMFILFFLWCCRRTFCMRLIIGACFFRSRSLFLSSSLIYNLSSSWPFDDVSRDLFQLFVFVWLCVFVR